MKTTLDPRHLKRVNLLKALYSQKFADTQLPPLSPDEKKMFTAVVKKLPEIHALIDKHTLKFDSEKMSHLDLAILEIGVYEMMYSKNTPDKVIVDECIELAKEYAGDNSPKFINGILGKLISHD